MTKSILDRPRAAAAARLERYLSIERGSGTHPAARLLHRLRRDGRKGAMTLRARIMQRHAR